MKKCICSVTVMAIVVCGALALSGCADLKNKFLPKSKETEKIPGYYAVKPYDIHPSLELYTKRYVYWKNWHKDLLAVLDSSNHKKTVVAVEQATSNLKDMQRMLIDEEAEKLGKIIDKMMKIQKDIKTDKVTGGNEVRIRRELENIGREVKKDFSYTEVRGAIRDDFSEGTGSGY